MVGGKLVQCVHLPYDMCKRTLGVCVCVGGGGLPGLEKLYDGDTAVQEGIERRLGAHDRNVMLALVDFVLGRCV